MDLNQDETIAENNTNLTENLAGEMNFVLIEFFD